MWQELQVPCYTIVLETGGWDCLGLGLAMGNQTKAANRVLSSIRNNWSTMSTRLPSMRYSLLVRDSVFIPIVSNCYHWIIWAHFIVGAEESSRHQEPWAAACSDASYATAARWLEVCLQEVKAKKHNDVTMLILWENKKGVFCQDGFTYTASSTSL